MTAIAVRFPDESVELDNVEEHRVLTTLEVIYEAFPAGRSGRLANTVACAISGQCGERHYHAEGPEQWKSPGQDDL